MSRRAARLAEEEVQCSACFRPSGSTEGEAILAAGDLLVLYSDGIVDAANGRGEMFGSGRLQSFLVGARERPVTEIVESPVG